MVYDKLINILSTTGTERTHSTLRNNEIKNTYNKHPPKSKAWEDMMMKTQNTKKTEKQFYLLSKSNKQTRRIIFSGSNA